MCGLICALHRDRLGYLPQGRRELYGAALSMPLIRRDRERDITEPGHCGLRPPHLRGLPGRADSRGRGGLRPLRPTGRRRPVGGRRPDGGRPGPARERTEIFGDLLARGDHAPAPAAAPGSSFRPQPASSTPPNSPRPYGRRRKHGSPPSSRPAALRRHASRRPSVPSSSICSRDPSASTTKRPCSWCSPRRMGNPMRPSRSSDGAPATACSPYGPNSSGAGRGSTPPLTRTRSSPA